MTAHTRPIDTLVAAGGTDPGLQRDVNEDRFHVDAARGLFIVIDGIGGQAAGGRAAEIALAMVRERLERETGPIVERVREAIAIANNEIYRLASSRREWDGMACVLTIAVVRDGRATIDHPSRSNEVGAAGSTPDRGPSTAGGPSDPVLRVGPHSGSGGSGSTGSQGERGTIRRLGETMPSSEAPGVHRYHEFHQKQPDQADQGSRQ